MLNAECRFDRKKRNTIKHKNLLSHIKMDKEILMFGDIKIEKNKFYQHNTPIFLKYVDNKIYFGEKNYKYTIGYWYNDHKVKS